jgi:hypothetical protein
MDFLRRLFGNGKGEVVQPDVRFGRYSDAYKPDHKYDAWDKALDLFEEENFTSSFEHFFDYLTDPEQDNVKTWTADDGLHFELLQGSKVIYGLIGEKIIKAEAKVAATTDLSIGFLRRMMELNYALKYSRYALDDQNNLTLIFDSFLLDGSPYKMYYALKEIAVSADKQDDLLVGEFKTLEPINTGHLKPVDHEQKAVKTEYIRSEIANLLQFLDKTNLNTEQYAGGIGYLMLELAYRLDYLIKPEGALTEALERIHRIYFASDSKSSSQKNLAVRKEYEQILERSDEDLQAEMYLTSSSFGITTPATHDQFVAFVDAELGNMDWYLENRHHELAMAFPGYITGYCLFNYAFQAPLQELLHLYYRIVHENYFKALGFTQELLDNGLPGKRSVSNAIESWRNRHRAKFPQIDLDLKAIDFSSMPRFSKTYFRAMRKIDMTKVGR